MASADMNSDGCRIRDDHYVVRAVEATPSGRNREKGEVTNRGFYFSMRALLEANQYLVGRETKWENVAL